MKKITFSIFLFATIISVAQDKIAYQIFDKNGKKTSYEKLLKAGEKADVVLFGEYHDNSVVHWLQLEFTKDLAQKKDLVLGAEMLEADNQTQVNQYLKGATMGRIMMVLCLIGVAVAGYVAYRYGVF